MVAMNARLASLATHVVRRRDATEHGAEALLGMMAADPDEERGVLGRTRLPQERRAKLRIRRRAPQRSK